MVFVSETLAGEPVGIAETASGHWIVRFADIDIGIIDRRTNTENCYPSIRSVVSPIYPIAQPGERRYRRAGHPLSSELPHNRRRGRR